MDQYDYCKQERKPQRRTAGQSTTYVLLWDGFCGAVLPVYKAFTDISDMRQPDHGAEMQPHNREFNLIYSIRKRQSLYGYDCISMLTILLLAQQFINSPTPSFSFLKNKFRTGFKLLNILNITEYCL